MRNAIILCAAMCCIGGHAYASCVASQKTYTSCKAGYYLESGKCKQCPSYQGASATSADKNTKGITACYIPSGSTFSNSTGSGVFTGNCNYVDLTGGTIIGGGGTGGSMIVDP